MSISLQQIILSQFLIRHPDLLLKYAVVNQQWQHRIKKLLYLCIQQLSLQNLSHAIPFRTLETFSSEEIVARYIEDRDVRHAYLEDVYNYLVKRKYFKLVRQLLEEKVPPLYDVVLSPPNSISETLLQMIQHPLKLLTTNLTTTSNESYPTTTIGSDCVNLVISSFVEEILAPVYTPPIQLFIVPCLAKNVDFPFLYLQKYFSEVITKSNSFLYASASMGGHGSNSATIEDLRNITDDMKEVAQAPAQCFDSSYLVNAFIKLDCMHLEGVGASSLYARDYIRVLAKLSNNIRKLPRRSAVSIFRRSDDDVVDGDSDSDSDSDSNDTRRRSGTGRYDAITADERDCLLEVIQALNDDERALFIVKSAVALVDDAEVLYSLSRICHNLMLYHRSAIFDYK